MSIAFWKEAALEALKERSGDLKKIRLLDQDAMEGRLVLTIDSLIRTIFVRLYGLSV